MYTLADVVATTLALDGHPGLLQLRALPVRGLGPRRRLRARQDDGLRQSRLDRPRRGDRALPQSFVAERVDEAAVADCIRAREGRERLPARPAHAPAAWSRRARRSTPQTRHIPHIALATAHPAKFPDAMRGDHGRAPRPAAAPRRRCCRTRSGSRCCPTISPPSSASSRARAARSRRSRRMSTRADHGSATACASSPTTCRTWRRCRWASGWRPARATSRRRARHLASARAHGLQGHRAAQRQRHRRGDRGGRRRAQCRDQPRDHRLLRAHAQGRHRPRARHPGRHPADPALRRRTSSSASAR